MATYEYNKGDYVDPQHKFIFLDYRVGKYLVQEECSGYVFEANRYALRQGKIACAPQRRGEYRSQLFRKYHVGDILGPDNNIQMIDDGNYGYIVTAKGKKIRKYLWKNLDTGIEFIATLSSVLSGNTSGVNSGSKGENKVASILDQLEVSYSTQHCFQDCLNPETGRKLKFDFYLPDYNCCIEYDGKQHSVAEQTFAELEGIENIQFRDNLKNQYCAEHNIGLLRIPYTEYDNISKEKICSFLGCIDDLALYNDFTAEVIKRFTKAGY